MIDSLEMRVEATIQDPQMIDAMLRGINAFSRFKSSLPFLAFSYTRTLLLKRPEFELVAMQWAPGSVSELHDHGDSRCWVAVIEGAVDVDNYERKDQGGPHADLIHTSSIRVAAGETDHRLNWRELHRVRNTADVSAYSLQIYSPRLTEYRIFDSSTGFYTTALAHYDSVCDLS
jgi:Cysteine dioxygenase type I